MVHSLGPGGTERQVTELAKSIDPSLFTPHVGACFASGIRADELRARGIPSFEVPVRSLTNKSTARGFTVLRRYIRTHGIRLVHTFDAPLNVFAAPVARINKVPVVLTSQRSYRDLTNPKYHMLVRFSHWIADGVVTNCEAVREHLGTNFGVPSGKVRICHNGLDTSVFHNRERRRDSSVEGASLVIGAVGLLRPEKRFELLLQAFAMVHRQQAGLKLLIVGDGPEREQLERQAAQLGIQNACVFRPAASDVAVWFRSIDIFVQCSSSEAMSNALMEAMACGCCPVASRVGGNPELVTEGETGLLFASGDLMGLAKQLETVIQNASLRARFASEGARKIAGSFSTSSAASRMEQIYLEMCTRRGVPVQAQALSRGSA